MILQQKISHGIDKTDNISHETAILNFNKKYCEDFLQALRTISRQTSWHLLVKSQ